MAYKELLTLQGVANLGFRGTLMSVALNSAVNGVLSAVALESGILVGSLVDAAIQTYVVEDCEKKKCGE